MSYFWSGKVHQPPRAFDIHLVYAVPAVVDLSLHSETAGKGIPGHASHGKPVVGGCVDVERSITLLLISATRDVGTVEKTEATPDPNVRPIASIRARAEKDEHQCQRSRRGFHGL